MRSASGCETTKSEIEERERQVAQGERSEQSQRHLEGHHGLHIARVRPELQALCVRRTVAAAHELRGVSKQREGKCLGLIF
jgi:hypothetical protein